MASLESAVELRLCEKRAGQLQNLISPAQLFDFTLQLLDALRLGGGDALYQLLACEPSRAAFVARSQSWLQLTQWLPSAMGDLRGIRRPCVPHARVLLGKNGLISCS